MNENIIEQKPEELGVFLWKRVRDEKCIRGSKITEIIRFFCLFRSSIQSTLSLNPLSHIQLCIIDYVTVIYRLDIK